MTGLSPRNITTIGRRELLAGVVSLSTISVTGCGESRSAVEQAEKTAGNPNDVSDSDTDVPEQVRQAEEEIQRVFYQLANIPIFDDGRFVFDMSYFEQEFEHRQVKRTAENAIERLERTSTDVVSKSRVEKLIVAAEIGRLLVAQRVMIHQTVAAGLNLERQIVRDSYEQGTDIVQDAFQFIENLKAIGENIEIRLPEERKSEIQIDRYNPSRIGTIQENLVEIVTWSHQIYEAFGHVLMGLKKYEEGNAAIESTHYEVAKSAFKESEEEFRAARSSFDEAQGTGREIPHLVHLVDGLRCLLPTLLASTSTLQKSMEEFHAGNGEKGKEIAKDAISSANAKAERCL